MKRTRQDEEGEGATTHLLERRRKKKASLKKAAISSKFQRPTDRPFGFFEAASAPSARCAATPTPCTMLACMLTASLLAFVSSSSSAASSAFTVDTSSPGAPLSRVLLDSFGSSHGATTLRATWRSHFAQVQRDIPFRRVRFHGLLDDDMSTFLDGRANGALVFDTLDFLVAQGIAPTIELSYMPAELALNKTAFYRHYMGLRSTYESAPAYRAFITGLVQLFLDRYGAAAVRSWRFEVWNEPSV